MNQLRILVCGGRDFGNQSLVDKVLDSLWEEAKDQRELIIIQGEADGADRLAKRWAINRRVKHLDFRADWRKLGKSAGFIRNKQMLDEGRPHMVVAFSGGKGTNMMVKLAKKVDVPIVDYRSENSRE